jgi:hypothetical protein
MLIFSVHVLLPPVGTNMKIDEMQSWETKSVFCAGGADAGPAAHPSSVKFGNTSGLEAVHRHALHVLVAIYYYINHGHTLT